ncbi:MAG TPA: lactate utilization protein [Aliidongia sp.]|uniref:LutC/YkgG family protein n=1 Tax=Aliidongia sp. TaxID=1914230 RepID=UPI002DDDA800|nr:lactate utilization protein [Aliidongia sp.]HEV2676852.1 lactate utilization protein [Aliidongia sp.]
MMDARSQILDGIRKSLKRGPLGESAATVPANRLAHHAPGLIPARTTALDAAGLRDLFVQMAEEVQTTVTRVSDAAAVPGAVADYLANHNLPAEITMAPDPALDAYPWVERPLLRIRRGRAEDLDQVSVTGAFAAIAETGTLMLTSGADRPTTLNLMPDTHVVVLRADQVVGPYETAWARLRGEQVGNAMPRTVNFITGPSRTGDIEQRIQLGAHGPRRLHIVLVEGPDAKTA